MSAGSSLGGGCCLEPPPAPVAGCCRRGGLPRPAAEHCRPGGQAAARPRSRDKTGAEARLRRRARARRWASGAAAPPRRSRTASSQPWPCGQPRPAARSAPRGGGERRTVHACRGRACSCAVCATRPIAASRLVQVASVTHRHAIQPAPCLPGPHPNKLLLAVRKVALQDLKRRRQEEAGRE